MQELIGKKIVSIRKSSDDTILCFNTDDDGVAYEAEGDCCSESWFNHVTGISFLIGGTVSSVEELPERGAEGTRQEKDAVYGWHIHTDKGTAHVEMRNSSNGYYGGCAKRLECASDKATVSIMDDY